jgi:protein gp37
VSATSKIEWTDATWNPVRGCTKISPGCKHCYAETFAERFRGVKGHPFENGFDLRLVPEKLADPIRWSTQRKIFVNSMSDLFHPQVPDEFIEKVCRVMLAANWHTYQVLTKRPDRMTPLLQTKLRAAALAPHIWWGVSVENKAHGMPRIDLLRKARPRVAFLSIEPLLEDLGVFNFDGIDWVIVGGESGHGARPMNAAWVRSIRSQCEAQKVSFFFKQWGGTQKSKAGRKLDGRTYDEFPEAPTNPVPSLKDRFQLLEETPIA